MNAVQSCGPAGAVHAEIACPRCASIPGDATTARPAPQPLLVVRLPVGTGPDEPTVSVERLGWALHVEANDGTQTWVHEVDLPFAVARSDLTMSRCGSSIELRIPVPGRVPATACAPSAGAR